MGNCFSSANHENVTCGVFLEKLDCANSLYQLSDYTCRMDLYNKEGQLIAKSLETKAAAIPGPFYSMGNDAIWDVYTPLNPTGTHSGEGYRLVVKLYEDGVITTETHVGNATLDNIKQYEDIMETVHVNVIPVGNKIPPSTIDIKVLSPPMYKVCNKLEAYANSFVGFAGHIEPLAQYHLLWENFFGSRFKHEGDRPTFVYSAMTTGPKTWCEIHKGEGHGILKLIPKSLLPTIPFGTPSALDLMQEWCRLHRKKDSVAIYLDSMRNVKVHEFQKQLSDLAQARVNVKSLESTFKLAPTQLGVLGGMGPVAGALFGEAFSKIVSQNADKFKDVGITMISDPNPEQWKSEYIALGQSVLATKEVLDWLSHPELKYTCAASNTFHLLMSPLGQPKSLVSIFDACGSDIKMKYPGQTVGLMCTTPSMKYADQGYGKCFEERGIKWIKPPPEIQEKTMDAIKLVKTPGADVDKGWKLALDKFLEVIHWYSDQGATVMALCCTEIPVVVKQAAVDKDPKLKGRIFCVDSIESLANYFSLKAMGGDAAIPAIAQPMPQAAPAQAPMPLPQQGGPGQMPYPQQGGPGQMPYPQQPGMPQYSQQRLSAGPGPSWGAFQQQMPHRGPLPLGTLLPGPPPNFQPPSPYHQQPPFVPYTV